MVQCDGCDLWIHLDCDNMTREQYEIMSKDESIKYFCPSCRVSRGLEPLANQSTFYYHTNQLGHNEPNNNENSNHEVLPENHNDKQQSPELEKEPENEERQQPSSLIKETPTQSESVSHPDDQSAEIVSAASIDSLLDFGV